MVNVETAGSPSGAARRTRRLVVGPVGDSEDHHGPGDVDGRGGGGPAETGEVPPLVVRQRAERILPAACHRGSRVHELHPG